jgi:predicted ribonuclease toxin of YeeF-YezG toxin-antitoxin module
MNELCGEKIFRYQMCVALVRFQVLTVMSMKISVFRVIMIALITEAANISDGKLLPDHMVKQPRRQPSPYSLL